MANCSPDQMLHSVCKCLSIPILRVITVSSNRIEKKKKEERDIQGPVVQNLRLLANVTLKFLS